jgi:glycerol kinase
MQVRRSPTDYDGQTQANIIGIPVDRPAMRETTALGAAIAAGFAVGVWKEFDELKEINQKDRMIFKPNVGKEVGEKMFKKWGRVRDTHERTASETCANLNSHL